MINPSRPSAKVIIIITIIIIIIIIVIIIIIIFKFLAGVSHNFTLANPYYACTLLLNIKYSLFTYFEKKS